MIIILTEKESKSIQHINDIERADLVIVAIDDYNFKIIKNRIDHINGALDMSDIKAYINKYAEKQGR